MDIYSFGYVEIRTLSPEEKEMSLEQFQKSLNGSGEKIATVAGIRQHTVNRHRNSTLTGNIFSKLLALDSPGGTFVQCEKSVEKDVLRPSVSTLQDIKWVALVRNDDKEFPQMIAP